MESGRCRMCPSAHPASGDDAVVSGRQRKGMRRRPNVAYPPAPDLALKSPYVSGGCFYSAVARENETFCRSFVFCDGQHRKTRTAVAGPRQ